MTKHPTYGSKKPRIIPRAEHNVTRAEFSKSALKVLYRLNQAGYEAFLVGGCVRDAMLELHPKDFDVATNARPQEIRGLFRSSRIIGRRFRLAHVPPGSHVLRINGIPGREESPTFPAIAVEGRETKLELRIPR